MLEQDQCSSVLLQKHTYGRQKKDGTRRGEKGEVMILFNRNNSPMDGPATDISISVKRTGTVLSACPCFSFLSVAKRELVPLFLFEPQINNAPLFPCAKHRIDAIYLHNDLLEILFLPVFTRFFN